ncbi:hypothetical protein [Tolypothrix sp. NIES-4075]|uniref:hypothetical protein n=1 Tax=Tolypothrix sp. NIES-4075 TaxID=2005459 RepID=UPI00117C491F|nr:hypothetical protein [Tolypothrix sp. NIES-4075]
MARSKSDRILWQSGVMSKKGDKCIALGLPTPETFLTFIHNILRIQITSSVSTVCRITVS